jgi:hypothetical protein
LGIDFGLTEIKMAFTTETQRAQRLRRGRRPKLHGTFMKTVLVIALLLLTCCGLIPEKVSLDDPKVQPLLMAAAKFDRIAHGFSPIPRVGDVRLELATGRPYDAMLHIYTKTSKTIAFKKSGNEYVWIAE